MTYTATYDPADNKIRLSATSRLDKPTYDRVRAAGFIWAPKQEVFVAPMWTPERADLAEELAGEIGDEDTTLVERAEDRAERFTDYHESRKEDADRAHAAVERITEHIPMGQPILVGHHSERHARRDAEKIQNGMRKAVKMWETAQYWKSRAAGAIMHAKYKERPDVRARRIKGLESDQRKHQKDRDHSAHMVKIWETLHDDEKSIIKMKDGARGTFLERARWVAGHLDCHVGIVRQKNDAPYTSYWDSWDVLRPEEERYKACPAMTPEEVQPLVIAVHQRTIAWRDRWLTHIAGRLEYERAMLGEAGGTVTDKKGPEKGGACRCWCSPGRFEKNKGWSYIQKVNKVSVTLLDSWRNGGDNFTRIIPFDKLTAVMSAEEVQSARDTGCLIECETKDSAGKVKGFYLRSEPIECKSAPAPEPEPEPDGAKFDALKDTLKAGVQVVSAPQLFPTPAGLAARMVDEANIQPGEKVLEPSAGTGRILEAIRNAGGEYFAVEIDFRLCSSLSERFTTPQDAERGVCTSVLQGDFLELFPTQLGQFDAVLMNPPFANGQDIAHIKHAMNFLKPGGILVAICANGPRQNDQLRPLIEKAGGSWETLPADTFKESGTSVNTALVVYQASSATYKSLATAQAIEAVEVVADEPFALVP